MTAASPSRPGLAIRFAPQSAYCAVRQRC
jgi:hypothetical protein